MCVLEENKSCNKCTVCGESRYKSNVGKGKKVPQKMLCCFPLKRRLQWLFISRYTTKEMKWHQEKCIGEEDILRHPADGEAWKDFNKSYPWFA